MSSAVCTTPGCAAGRASVTALRAIFTQLLEHPSFQRSHFEPSVRAIEADYAANSGFFDTWIPFNPACCVIEAIGKQADDLVASMLASVGAAPPGDGPSSGPPALDVNALVTLGALMLGAVILSNVLPLLRRSA
jgi:hypothetical protein